jgi:hypothetical protein
MASIINALTASGGGVAISGDATGNLALQSAGNTAVTIDTSQNVGIGTSTPTAKLSVTGTGTLGSVFQQIISNGATNLRLGTNSTAAEIQSTGGVPLYLNYGGNDVVLNSTGGNLQFNSGYGSAAVAYGCRAWVNFNGTGTVAIRASGNVSSITDNGIGTYRVNFTNNMPDGNYSVVATTTVDRFASSAADSNPTNYADVRSTNTSATYTDVAAMCVAIFR